MDAQKVKDIKDIALKLEKIREECPENYFYLKGWIHCLLQKEEKTAHSHVKRRNSREEGLG